MSRRPGLRLEVPDEKEPLDVRTIESFRNKALRTGVWHVLQTTEKGLLKCVLRDRQRKPMLRNSSLVKQLLAILSKISMVMGHRIRQAFQVGREIVEGLSVLAVSWGNQAASGWTANQAFQLALGLGVLSRS